MAFYGIPQCSEMFHCSGWYFMVFHDIQTWGGNQLSSVSLGICQVAGHILKHLQTGQGSSEAFWRRRRESDHCISSFYFVHVCWYSIVCHRMSLYSIRFLRIFAIFYDIRLYSTIFFEDSVFLDVEGHFRISHVISWFSMFHNILRCVIVFSNTPW